jgi:hypothetical protein
VVAESRALRAGFDALADALDALARPGELLAAT